MRRKEKSKLYIWVGYCVRDFKRVMYVGILTTISDNVRIKKRRLIQHKNIFFKIPKRMDFDKQEFVLRFDYNITCRSFGLKKMEK